MPKVFIVDDAPADLAFARGILADAKYEVVTCDKAAEAEDRIAEAQPDVILLDIVMPERSGYDILRKLRKNPETRAIPVALVSSKTEPSDVLWGKTQGADDYLLKPYQPSDLVATVEHLLGRKTAG
jgi:twitching motility two-component system response regulator PilH